MSEDRPRSALGPTLLLLILLGDVGLIVWGWFLHQANQSKYNAVGLNFSGAPRPEGASSAPAASRPARPDSLKFLVRDLSPAAGGNPAPEAARSDAPKPYDPRSADPHTRSFMNQASVRYFSLLHSARFKRSAVIQGWKRDFLSYPDLRVINARYRQDKDAMRFMAGMLRSPNFPKLVDKYISAEDVQAFVKEMAASPQVLESGRTFLQDYNLGAAVKHLNVPGMPALAETAQAPGTSLKPGAQ